MEQVLEANSATLIAETKEYSIKYNSSKNRFYLQIIGFWESPQQISGYLNDWEKALTKSRPGFTLLTDVTQMSIHPQSVREIHKKAQNLIVKAGVSKVAELQKNKIAEIQLNGLSKDTNMPKMNFNDLQQAIQYLSA